MTLALTACNFGLTISHLTATNIANMITITTNMHTIAIAALIPGLNVGPGLGTKILAPITCP